MPATLEVLRGKARVPAFVVQALHRNWNALDWIVTDINGAKGVMVRKDGATIASITFAYDESGSATAIMLSQH